MFISLARTIKLTVVVIMSLVVMTGNVQIKGVRAENMVLSETEIKAKIQELPDWTTNGEEISRTFQFPDFVTAIDFVNKLVEPAESAGHHPDIAISYNKVTINLTTHDAGGITDKDFELAKTISELAQ